MNELCVATSVWSKAGLVLGEKAKEEARRAQRGISRGSPSDAIARFVLSIFHHSRGGTGALCTVQPYLLHISVLISRGRSGLHPE